MNLAHAARRSAGFAPQDMLVEEGADGALLLRSPMPLGETAVASHAWLHRWADAAPARVFLAERSGDGWRKVSYAEALQRVRAIAAGLLGLGLTRETPIAVLSGNGIDHGLLALAAQYVGIPLAPLAEQYSLIPEAAGRLSDILARLSPKLVFAADAERFAAALALPEIADAVKVCSRGSGGSVISFEALERGASGVDIAAANRTVGPDTLAKILFTSGSTSAPKGVLTTQRMMSVNQTQIRQVWPFLTERPPVIVDWLPWNHVFGGSHNFNLMLSNGGSLYIDDGKPTPSGIGRSIEAIRQVSPTISFNVPVAYAQLIDAMRADAGLARAFFGDLDLIFYAGASLPQHLWEGLESLAMQVCGQVPLMSSSWGMTETAPACIMVHAPIEKAGVVGVPLPAVEAKLVPDGGGRYELRVRGPNITPGYHGDAATTAKAFDADGFLITGDAVRLADPARPALGVQFDGRVAEDFKLLTGTWVQVSKLRIGALPVLAPIASDLVVTGHDRGEIGALIFADRAALRALDIEPEDDGEVLSGEALMNALRQRLDRLAQAATGSSTRIVRALVMSAPPSVRDAEITDKGYINQRNVLQRRARLVERLYADGDAAVVVISP